MTKLYILDEINNTVLNQILKTNSLDLIAFDYESHKQLSIRNISHKLIDDFLTDFDRKKLFEYCNKCLKKIEEFDSHELFFHGINLLSLIDRNELHEFLMDIIPKIKVVNQILKDNNYEKIFLPYNIYKIFVESKYKEKIDFINKTPDEFTSFEKIIIPIKIGVIKSKITIGRKKYKKIKQLLEKYMGYFFGLRKNDKKKIVLLEFNPETYHILLEEINKLGFKPVLLNFRKSPINNLKSLKFLVNSNSTIIIPEDWIKKNTLDEFEKNKNKLLSNINKIIDNKKNLLDFDYNEINFSMFLQHKLNQLLIQRFDEYMLQILIAESIQSRSDVKSILTLNFSGETEKVFSNVRGNIPILHLQHAFANYTESISHFDVLDDFNFVRDKIAVWGDVVRDYLINIKKIDRSKILVTGSPKYDSFVTKTKEKTDKKTILVSLRPVITHMEGPRISLFDRYEETLKKIYQITKNNPDVEIIFKLHPQQNKSNEIIKNMIITNNQIKFFQYEPINELFQNCDLHVNVATDNFDASSVILEAMLSKKPTLNIELQQNRIEFEFIKDNAIKTVNYSENLADVILDLLDENNSLEIIKNSQKFLQRYMKNRNRASNVLINSLE
ncbi:MAG: UDP-N-acetylglucosamine 2-epimerase [Candidatus Nitrosopumilus sp. bin_68KS]